MYRTSARTSESTQETALTFSRMRCVFTRLIIVNRTLLDYQSALITLAVSGQIISFPALIPTIPVAGWFFWLPRKRWNGFAVVAMRPRLFSPYWSWRSHGWCKYHQKCSPWQKRVVWAVKGYQRLGIRCCQSLPLPVMRRTEDTCMQISFPSGTGGWM